MTSVFAFAALFICFTFFTIATLGFTNKLWSECNKVTSILLAAILGMFALSTLLIWIAFLQFVIVFAVPYDLQLLLGW